MAIYRDRVLPRIIDVACASSELAAWRRRCVEGLHGVVVEPGFGSGLNVEWYPDEVERVYAVDPAVIGRELAADRVRARGIPVEHVGLDGQRLPIADDSCDSALLTFTLCTVPDPMLALGELRRVLRPGGCLHFLEHGLADTDRMARWQHRIDPLQRRLFDGCHLSRDHAELVTAAGFDLVRLEHGWATARSPWSRLWLGLARSGRP